MSISLVSELLQDSRPAIRYAAAESLVSESEYVIPIAVAASSDPALITLAARSFVLHAPTLDSFKLLFAMPGEAQQRITLLTFLASVMPADQLQSAITVIGPEPALLDRIHATLENPNRILSESQDDNQATAIAKGLLTLAQARLQLGKPDAALAASRSRQNLCSRPDAPLSNSRCKCLQNRGFRDKLSYHPPHYALPRKRSSGTNGTRHPKRS